MAVGAVKQIIPERLFEISNLIMNFHHFSKSKLILTAIKHFQSNSISLFAGGKFVLKMRENWKIVCWLTEISSLLVYLRYCCFCLLSYDLIYSYFFVLSIEIIAENSVGELCFEINKKGKFSLWKSWEKIERFVAFIALFLSVFSLI